MLLNGAGGGCLPVGEDVRVCGCLRHRAVAENLAGRLEIDLRIEQQRGGCMPKIMKPADGNACGHTQRSPRVVVSARIAGATPLVREHPPGVVPVRRGQALGGLALTVHDKGIEERRLSCGAPHQTSART